jgi:hypothetical protein
MLSMRGRWGARWQVSIPVDLIVSGGEQCIPDSCTPTMFHEALISYSCFCSFVFLFLSALFLLKRKKKKNIKKDLIPAARCKIHTICEWTRTNRQWTPL